MRKKEHIIDSVDKEKGYLERASDYVTEHKYSILAHAFSAVCFAKGTYDIFIEKDADTGFEEYKIGLITLGGGEWIKYSHENPKNRKKTVETIKDRYPDASLYKTMEELYEQATGHLESTKENNVLKFILEQSNSLEEYKKIVKSIIDNRYDTDVNIDSYLNLFISEKTEEEKEGVLENIQRVRKAIDIIQDISHPIFEFKDPSKLK